MQEQKRILWAASSVGKGHIMRDMAIVKQSAQLLGSGKVYEEVFSDCVDEFNLISYIAADTKLHKHDFLVSTAAWEQTPYDGIVGDEAFWLLTGFASRW